MPINVSNKLKVMTLSSDKIHRIIGERIRDIRKQQRLTQEELAEKAGIDRSHMGFIEQGRRQPTVTTLHKIAQALSVSFEKLFRGL